MARFFFQVGTVGLGEFGEIAAAVDHWIPQHDMRRTYVAALRRVRGEGRAQSQTGQHDARDARKAPQLAGFLAQMADQSGIDIPESQDRPTVPHGKKFDERSTQIRLRQVGMLKLATFMEKIEQSGNAVTMVWNRPLP